MNSAARPQDDLRAIWTDPLPDEPLTELGYARRLVYVFGDDLRFVPAWGRWLYWDGTRWAHDTTGRAARAAKSVARRVTDSMDDGDREADKLARRQESSAAVSGTLKLAGTEPELVVTPDSLDTDPWLLNCANGTLDLRTGELRPHDRADLITKAARGAYDPAAAGGEFRKFMLKVQPDKAMRSYLRRLTGHSLAGKVIEHVLPIYFGAGANGKSTFMTAVTDAMGDYAAPADPELLSARDFASHPTSQADLFGLRLAILHESDQGRRLAEGTVKRLTGGDRVKARRMREDFWSFNPSHTFIWLANHRPLVSGTDEGIWRRIRLVPWPVVIPAAERDENLGDKLALELDYILTWLVQGCLDWRRDGLADPEAVTAATAAYRAESDTIGRFIGEACSTSPAMRAPSSRLFAAWSKWCAAEGEDPRTQKWFSAELEGRGYDKGPTRTGVVWRGIGIRAEETLSDDQLRGDGS